jgi:beta-galactosidase
VLRAASAKADDTPASTSPDSPHQSTLLDPDWRFYLGDITPSDKVITPDFDDKDWQPVDVPHDYVLFGKYDEHLDRNHGYLPVDVAWYRRHLQIPADAQGKILSLDFDGVYRDSQVYFNGQLLGEHQSGYTPFSYDITKLAKIGGDNLIAVRVDPRKFEGWWYEGGGIYRHVHLTALSPVHLQQWGVYVTSTVPGGDNGESATANINIQTTLENHTGTDADCVVECKIEPVGDNPEGNSVTILKATQSVPANGQVDAKQETKIDQPKLWSLESPNLYKLHTTILQNGKPVDESTTTFGIRTIRFDKDKGFFLNGKRVEIQGAACHQDFAGVGIAIPDSIQAWRVAQLKKFGCNGWRTAHNPCGEAVMNECDRIGMLVMDENRHLGDCYTAKTPTGTTADDLTDLATMIRRDRNHPSIIMWSMCNEEDLQGTPEAAALIVKMMKEVHRWDQTRPITSAMNGHEGVKIFLDHGIADVEEMIGVNYNYESLDRIRARHPDKPMFGSEDQNEKTARGEYADNKAAGLKGAYNLSEKTWQDFATRPWLAGSYTWTGIDYKGEPNPFGWPDVSNNTGLLDSCAFPKDKAYYFQSCWTKEPMVHILPSTWNWPGKEGKPIRVLTWSNAPKVELFLNDKSLGIKNIPPAGHAEWKVPFAPGHLVAKAMKGDEVVATDEQQTTNPAKRIEVTADRTTLNSTGEDAIVAKVALLDDQGRVVPDSANRVTFKLSEGGRMLGVGNGNPADHDTDKADNRKAFHGRCIVVIQANNKPGTLHLTASSPGLDDGSLKLEIK